MKKINFLSIALLSFFIQLSAADIDQLISDFSGNEWQKVLEAKSSLENMQEEAIPKIIELLDQDKTVKLTKTGDLIYPGASKFYGHGMMVEYAIDQLDVRAGWLLEEMTFMSFGFGLIHDLDENLITNIKQNFREYLSQKLLNELEKMETEEIREKIKEMAIDKAQKWWKEEFEDWNRLDGVIDALNSDNSRRQVLALKYLKSGTSPCSGLSIETYLDELKSRISYLSKSKVSRISEYSIFILNDSDFGFIRIKSN